MDKISVLPNKTYGSEIDNGNHEYTYTSDSNFTENNKTINPASELRSNLEHRITPKTPTRNIIPQVHEVTVNYPVRDLALYHRIITVFQNGKKRIDSKDNNKEFVTFNLKGKEFHLKSSHGGLYPPGKDKTAYNYWLHWEDEKGAANITYQIHPTFGRNTRTKTGEIVHYPEGTNFRVTSSNFDLKELLSLTEEFLFQIDASRFFDQIKFDSGTIEQFEVYIRYHEDREPHVRQIIETEEKYAPTKGHSLYRKELEDEAAYNLILSPPNWEFLGFDTPFPMKIKSYRARGWEKRSKEHPLRHPKLGVSVAKHSRDDENLALDKYYQVKEELTKMLLNQVYWMGIKEEDFIEDDYFKIAFDEKYIQFKPWIESDADKAINEKEAFNKELPISQPKAMSLLAELAIKGCISIRDLAKKINLGYRQTSRYIDGLINIGILDKEIEEQVYVFWKSHEFRDKFIEAVKGLASLRGAIPGFDTLYGTTILNPVDEDIIKNNIRNLEKRVYKKRNKLYDFLSKPKLEIPANEAGRWGEAVKDFKKECPNGIVLKFTPANKWA